MTIGLKTLSSFSKIGTYTQQYDDPRIYGPLVDVGKQVIRQWSGGDYPSLRPTFEIFSYVSSNGKVILRSRRRTDAPTRRKTADHPYTLDQTTRNESEHLQTVYYSYNTFPGPVSVEAIERISYGNGAGAYGGGPCQFYGMWDSNDELALLGKLREAVAGSDFNAGVSLGESREALNMIFGASTKIFKALKAVKRFDIVGAAAALSVKVPKKSVKKTSAENWLELQYGWLPLLGDVHGASQFLAKQLEFPLVQTYRVRRKKVLEPTWGNPSLTKRSALGVTRTQILARLSEVDVIQLSGLTDPLSVAWELVPFSFIADWFIPVGSYLSARGLAQSLTGSFVRTETTKTSWFHGPLPDTTIPFIRRWTYIGGERSESRVTVNRTVTSSLSIPLPKAVGLGEAFSWKRAANAVALVTSIFGGPFKVGRNV